MEQTLKLVIRNSISTSENELDFILSLFKPLTLKKGDYFLKAGQRCNKVAFVESGMLRICYPNEKGEETTCYFSLPGDFITSFASFTNNTPSTENIEAIMATECLVIIKQDLENLYRKVPASQELGRKAAENVAIFMEKRLGLFLNNSADERYQYLLTHNPLFIQTIPLQYLASFLGITPQHLSRLRKKFSK